MENRNLAQRVLEFSARARSRPAEAVGPELDALAEDARRAISGSFVAQTSPVANYTWLSRAVLDPATLYTTQEPIVIPYDCELVGVLPTILLVDTTAGLVEPPIEAIDVFMQIDRKDTLTARAETTVTATQDAQMINLPSVSATIANRCFSKQLDAQSSMSVKFGWATDLATVAALKWGKVQISLNWYVIDRTGEKGGGR